MGSNSTYISTLSILREVVYYLSPVADWLLSIFWNLLQQPTLVLFIPLHLRLPVNMLIGLSSLPVFSTYVSLSLLELKLTHLDLELGDSTIYSLLYDAYILHLSSWTRHWGLIVRWDIFLRCTRILATLLPHEVSEPTVVFICLLVILHVSLILSQIALWRPSLFN